MKNLVIKWWELETARYMKHPYFWTIVTVGSVVWLLHEYRVVKRLEAEYDVETATPEEE